MKAIFEIYDGSNTSKYIKIINDGDYKDTGREKFEYIN